MLQLRASAGSHEELWLDELVVHGSGSGHERDHVESVGLVLDRNGKAQKLWRCLGDEFAAIARSGSKSLDKKISFHPGGVLASIFAPKHTFREVALICWDLCQKPLSVKADLIFPYHGGWGELPADKCVWKWTKLSHANKNAIRFPPAGDIAKALVACGRPDDVRHQGPMG